MAINRLTDIVGVMKSKWTYGDKDFAYTFEVNEQHNTNYPYMMISPPNSEFPEVYGGWEAYDFEIDFFDLYQTANQNAVVLEQKWDNLQDLGLEWIDNVMIHFNNPGGADVGIYFLEETLEFERVKEVANDRLVQIKMRFTMRAVTRCLFGNIPDSYPNQISNLALWLKADSGLTYNKSTKKISAWADQSGNNNNVGQSTSAQQPLRYSYDGASDKTRINFDGTADNFVSDSNSPINTDFTIFTVAQAAAVTPAFTNTYSTHFELGTELCEIGNPAGGAGGQLFSFTDGAGNDQPFSISVWVNIDPTNPWRGWIEKNEIGQAEYSFQTEYASGDTLFKIFDNAGNTLGKRVQIPVFPKGEWVHAVCTYDGSGTNAGQKIYFDGVLQVSSASNAGVYTAMTLTTSKLDIGNSNANPYYGDIDEASIFDSELSQADITELYNLGNPNDVASSTPSANLIGWWRMGDGATFPTIPDESTNSNDGTLLNMVASDIRANAPNSEESSYFTYELGNVEICLGSSSERLYCHVADAVAPNEWNARYIWDGDTSEYHIATMQLDSSTTNLKLQYNNSIPMEGTMPGYSPGTTYNSTTFNIGNGTHLGYLDGNLQELIIYNRVLNSNEIDTVRNYLNNKYKIY